MRPFPFRSTVLGVGLLALVTAACGDDQPPADTAGDTTTTAATLAEPVIDPGDGGDYDPAVDPSAFGDVIDNPYLPMPPGAQWAYEGDTEDGLERTEVVVTGDRREVMGVSTWIVRDTVTVDGEIVEDTFDYFAQDQDGNVWYFGEDSREFEGGIAVRASGSWEAGIDGAMPGIVMPANPAVGFAYRQEFDPGNAEDMGEILAVGEAREVAGQTYDDVVVTRDWSPLEPEIIEEKWYARGIGSIRSTHTAGEAGTAELVEHTVPGS